MTAQSSIPTALIAKTPTFTVLAAETAPWIDVSTDISRYETSSDDEEVSDSDAYAFNYYFLLLAVFAFFVAALLWYLHRRRAKKRALVRRSGQHALARDIEGWAGTRRFMHGRYRPSNAVLVRQNEGLNEHGEAPPPYQPKVDGPTVDVTIPLQTLSRDENERSHPPQYYSGTRTQPDSNAR
jgi:hypothetical protein